MKKESLEKAKDVITTALLKADIDRQDSVELILNINILLNNYNRDLRILIENQEKLKGEPINGKKV